MPSYLDHPLLRPNTVERRLFQLDLAATALKASTLVVVPTGLGKTVVALMVLLARLEMGRILFLAPTRPLVEQHASFLRQVLMDPSMVEMMTGEMPPDDRAQAWARARIVVSTPQVIENDLLSRRISLEDVSLVIFDEAHRAVGSYSYVYIAGRYSRESEDPLVLGITASPGSESEKIAEICSNLGIVRIQTRSESDPDVAPFIHHREIEWVKVAVPEELLRIRDALEGVLRERIDDLNRLGVSPARIDHRASKKELLSLQATLVASSRRQPNPAFFRGISMMAEILKLHHAVELAETQGPDALLRYLQRLEGEALSKGGSKASRRIMEEQRTRQAMEILRTTKVEHPKLPLVRRILREQIEQYPESRIMVFTNYRDTASALMGYLRGDPLIRAERFVGQSSREDDEGLSQRRQAEILGRFRDGQVNVLIATSVGEEGIDIPSTDLVLFYEPVPSEIRSIQRKGRTGRARAGRVVVLMARGTRDEAYYWISDRKERSMRRQMKGLSERVSSERMMAKEAEIRQTQITDLHEGGVLVDPREREMGKLLEARGLSVTLRTLEVGDYVVSDRLAIERKTAQDFVESIIDPERNLFRQVADLSRSVSYTHLR
ncbi:MAG: DEAD/DEAH box helicase, partial [Methanothrix sp.]|nr:DEAD/DEAH box helicase [Methanothrix sp.]